MVNWALMLQHRFRRTTLITIGSMACLAGIGLARFKFAFPASYVWLALSICLVLWRGRKPAAMLGVILLGLSLGCWRGYIYMNKLADYQNLNGQKVTVVGQAQDDAVYGTNYQLSFPLGKARVVSTSQRLSGTIGIKGFGEAAVYRGDTVEASGKLYVTRGNNQASISYASLQIKSRGNSLVDNLRRQFIAGTQSALPEPLASFGLGLLIGQRSNLPTAVAHQLTAVGLTHVIAVSGYNLTILVEAARQLLGNRSKRQTLFVSLVLMGLFVLLTGTSASIVRAALVSLLSIGAWYYGRNIKPVVLITFAAALTGLLNPFYVWSNIGWYLSFLAFFGVLVLAPLVMARLFGDKKPSVLTAIIIESLCAELMTIPIILYIFGQVSLVALPANALVLAFVPLGMLLSFVAGLGGMLVPAMAGWLAWPAKILLTYMLDIVSVLSHVPHSFVQTLSLPLTQMLLLYALVAGLCILLWQKTKRIKNDKITSEK